MENSAKFANEMSRTFTKGHTAEQTVEYRVWQDKYLQSLTDVALSQVFIPPQKKSHFDVG